MHHEIAQQIFAFRSVCYFRVKLNAIDILLIHTKRGDTHRGRTGNDVEVFRNGNDCVGMRHPNLRIERYFLEQLAVVVDGCQSRASILAVFGWRDLTTRLFCNQLGPITNTQYGNFSAIGFQVEIRRTWIEYGAGTAGKDHTLDFRCQRRNLARSTHFPYTSLYLDYKVF